MATTIFGGHKGAPIAKREKVARGGNVGLREPAKLQGLASGKSQMVEGTKLCEECLHRTLVGEIERVTFGARWQPDESLLHPTLAARGYHDRRPFPRRGLSRCKPDPRAAAEDDDALSSEFHGRISCRCGDTHKIAANLACRQRIFVHLKMTGDHHEFRWKTAGRCRRDGGRR